MRASKGRLGRIVLAASILVAIAAPLAYAATRTITISSFAFPATTTVHVGDTVTWRNQSGATHNATADGGSFATGSIPDGGSKSVTFDAPGSFAYHCTIHQTMTGTIVVTGSAPATDTASDPRPAEQVDTTAVILALLGLTMLGGTVLADRRLARRRRD